MRNLKVLNKDGSTSLVKLPKDGCGKHTENWYRRQIPTVASIKASIVRRGGKFIGTRQR